MHRVIPRIFLNVILPLSLLFAFIIRPSLLSAFYGILLLIWPFVPDVTVSVPEFTKRYLLVSVLVTWFGILAQVIFQIVLAALPHDDTLPDCSELASALRFIGLQRLNVPDAGHAFRLIAPDIAACVASLSTLASLLLYARTLPHVSSNGNSVQLDQLSSTYRPTSDTTTDREDNGDNVEDTNTDDQAAYVSRLLNICLARLSEVLVVVLLCAAAIVHPSLLSSVYFLSFLFAMTWWALYKPISSKVFSVVKLLLVAYSAFHLILLYLYQTREFQIALPPETISARLLGLTVIVNCSCNEFWILNVIGQNRWPVYANPAVVFAFYVYVALQTVSTHKVGCRAIFKKWYKSTSSQGTPAKPRSSSNEELLGNESEEDGECGRDSARTMSHRSDPPSARRLGRSKSKPAIRREYTRLFSIGGTMQLDQADHRALATIIAFIIRHSYALALVMMMAWAITYHSWLSFVWLALACIIWMMADSRQACFLLSPFIVFYAEVLLCLQFIYGLDLSQHELPDAYELTGVPLRQIGLMKPDVAACVPLFIKAFYSIPFWITLRLYIRERHHQCDMAARTTSPPATPRGITFQSSFSGGSVVISNSLVGFLLVKYWIYVVGLVLLLVSVRTPVVAYEVCYMAFFVVLITVLQVSFTLWRLMIFIYWTVLTAFSIGVLLLVYTYQFSEVPTWWHNWTKWPNETFRDLGLVSYYPGTLFVQLLTPISFLIVVILQMKFFHSSFMRLTDFCKRSEKPRPETDVTAPESKWFSIVRAYYETACGLLWRLAAIHFAKLAAFAMVILAVSEVCAVNAVFVVIACCMLPCRRMNTPLSVIATIWAALVVLAKMIYQMNFIDVSFLAFYEKNCTTFAYIDDPGTWAGFSRVRPGNTVSQYLKGYVAVFVLLTFRAIINIRQRYGREVLGEPALPDGVLFPGIGRQDADASITKCLKFLANYGFYKFGLEITFITIVIDVGIRMDAVAFIYTVWLLVMLAMPRRTLAGAWWTFVLFVAASICTQYAVCVGLPPSACLQYPWAGLSSKLTYWLFLPNYEMKPNQYFLIGDFFILVAASAQFYVFGLELSRSDASYTDGGDNAPIWHYNFSLKMDTMRLENCDQQQQATGENVIGNPTPNFITSTKSYLDLVKIFIFVYFHWITLFVVFAAGVGGISGFAFGYLVAAFALLWKGNDLYLEPHSRVMVRWHIILFYNVFAIMLKISLQVVGCVYICSVCDSSTAWVVQLFSIACLRASEEKCVSSTHNAKCSVSKGEAEIFYDAICFVFLVFQIRIFSSWYFRHAIAEFRAERILSARGAQLINQLIRKEMHQQKMKEDRILRRVKAKTERIRKHYLKQMEGKKHFEPSTYAETKRGGDYYMFAYDSDDDEELEELEEKEPVAPETADNGERTVLGPAQLLHIAGQKSFDMSEALSEAGKREAVIKRELSWGVRPSTSWAGADATDISLAPVPKEEDEDKPVEVDSVEPEVESRSRSNELADGFKFLAMFIGSILNSLALTFNRWSRDYRYVAFVLKGEKRRLKETLTKELQHENDLRRVRQTIFREGINKKIHFVHTMADIETAEREAQESALEYNVVARFLMATYYLLVSHTELLCYLMIVLDHMGNAAIISLPLPLLAFFWGTLCSPRPPKFFWVTVITYTEAMIVVKFMFQFGFWQFDKRNEFINPFYGPKLLGIEQKRYYAAYDVALLMCLFFHRYVLKTLGLWKDAHYEENVGEDDADLDQNETEQTPTQEEEDKLSREDSEPQNGQSNGDETGGVSVVEADLIPRRQSVSMQGRLAYCSSIISFYRRLLNPRFRYVMDLYVFIFLCDLVCFLVLAFGYSAFGEVRGRQYSYDVVSDIQQNKVPLPFVTMLITLMILIIIDRAIYLSKSVVGKLVFQYLLVTVVHAWVFFGLPAMTDGPISRNGTAQLWYFVKCVYFLLSAWQIRNSYPSRIQGNLLAKKFGLTNYCLFTGFMAAPFLFELRTLIDWIWTETSMPLFDYFNMENMYACVFRSKCMRQYEKEYPVPRDIPKPKWIKYGLGLPILILIVVLLWLPLILFALVNAIGNRVPPEEAQFSVLIEGYPPLYAMSAQNVHLHKINETQYNNLYDLSSKNKQGLAFLKQYWEADIYVAHFRSSSMSKWTISPPSKRSLLYDLKNGTDPLVISFIWHFIRPSQNQKQLPQSHVSSTDRKLKKGDKEGDRIRQQLIDALEGRNVGGVIVSRAFSPFLVLPSVGMVQPAMAVSTVYSHANATDETDTFAGVKLYLNTVRDEDGLVVHYWSMKMDPPKWMKEGSYTKPDDDVKVTVFVDRVFPTYLDTFTSGGIMGLYVVVVLAAGRFIRSLVVQSPLDVILNEMPNVDRVLQLCLDVFLVREAGDFLLEQDLFAKLIFLFRSPETLIRWTRPKVE